MALQQKRRRIESIDAEKLALTISGLEQAVKKAREAIEKEMEEAPKFDFIVYNREGRIDDAAREIGSIIDRERTSRG